MSPAAHRDEFRREAIAYRSDNWRMYSGVVSERREPLSVSMSTNFGTAVSGTASAVNLVWSDSNVSALSEHMALTVSLTALLHAGSTGTTFSAWGGMISLSSGEYVAVGSALPLGGGAPFAAGGIVTLSSVSGSNALPQTAVQGEIFELL
jgi:hypothetical protein